MKSKELIKQLQELDPTGEIEVAVGNQDIWLVDCYPAYYDGNLQVLKRINSEYYDITGVEFKIQGSKIDLRPMGFDDVIFNAIECGKDPDITWDHIPGDIYTDGITKTIIETCHMIYYEWPVHNHLFAGQLRKKGLQVYGI